jgi:hypothetical protein
MKRTATLLRLANLAALAGVLAACGGPAPLPDPRTLVNTAGVRVNADPQEMEVVDEFVRRSLEDIQRDPSFMLILQAVGAPVRPWEELRVNQAADSVWISLERGASDAVSPYQIYGHLHLMARRGEMAEWLPEAEGAEGFELERAILERIADVWLYGRAIYDAAPYAPLDELLWASQAGYLDEYILTARGDEFPEARQEFEAARGDRLDAYRDWFEETFESRPPGLRSGSGS